GKVNSIVTKSMSFLLMEIPISDLYPEGCQHILLVLCYACIFWDSSKEGVQGDRPIEKKVPK
ncbi:hypothetical protein QQP08_017162, partial [Theobroma cacao]